MITSDPSPTFDVWAYTPSKGASADGWSMIAQAVTWEQAMVYRATCVYKINFQQHEERA